MAIEIVDVTGLARRIRKRKLLMNTDKMHAWEHYFKRRGEENALHCHAGDQTFVVLEGECTIRFPDGGSEVMTPGMVALIGAGSFYQLINTNNGPTVLLGTRSGPKSSDKQVDYASRKVRHAGDGKPDYVLGADGEDRTPLGLAARLKDALFPRRNGLPPRRGPRT
ncbi:MAG: cupin domain-containing protein [Alphaproteobacteria bacterium]|nr:cupin domain-containing protein [Alphaproteobacteria bacterium]